MTTPINKDALEAAKAVVNSEHFPERALMAEQAVRAYLASLPTPSPASPAGVDGDAVRQVGNLLSAARAFLDKFNPSDLPEDKSQQWLSVFDQIALVEARLPALSASPTPDAGAVAYIVHEPDKHGADHWYCDASNYAAKVEAGIAGVRLTPLFAHPPAVAVPEGLREQLQRFIWEIEPQATVVTPSKTQKIARRLRAEVVERLKAMLAASPNANPQPPVERERVIEECAKVAESRYDGYTRDELTDYGQGRFDLSHEIARDIRALLSQEAQHGD
jgi:hypothetical protein